MVRLEYNEYVEVAKLPGLFQFLNGAIRIDETDAVANGWGNFNSSMVRLEL